MKAVHIISHGSPGHLMYHDTPAPVAATGEVVVRVRACGLNRLDLWHEEGALPIKMHLPRIPGGEVSGEIHSLGQGVTNEWRIGDRVAVQSNLFCGKCEFCVRGEESICINGQLLGVHRDGGFAELVAAPASALVRLPDNISFQDSAALTLAASTAMHMLTNRTMVRPGDYVLVIGASSGVGSGAIQIAKQLGGYVIATASSEAKRKFALHLGADFVIDTANEDWPAEVRRITQKRGVDIVVEHVGGETLLQCFQCLARGGTIVTCGATSGREVCLKLWSFFVKEQKLVGSYGRNRADIKATLDWAAEGKIKPVIDRTFPLERTRDAFNALRHRHVLGKLVILP